MTALSVMALHPDLIRCGHRSSVHTMTLTYIPLSAVASWCVFFDPQEYSGYLRWITGTGGTMEAMGAECPVMVRSRYLHLSLMFLLFHTRAFTVSSYSRRGDG
jgi:hypothetical protein